GSGGGGGVSEPRRKAAARFRGAAPPLLLRQELARQDLLPAQWRIMLALLGLGGRGDDGLRKLLVVAQALGEAVAIHLPAALLVHLQDRGRGGAGEIVAHPDLAPHHRPS